MATPHVAGGDSPYTRGSGRVQVDKAVVQSVFAETTSVSLAG
ncbi:hypothetical protein ACFZCL_11115 [Streptomyces sp. NPDC008159]